MALLVNTPTSEKRKEAHVEYLVKLVKVLMVNALLKAISSYNRHKYTLYIYLMELYTNKLDSHCSRSCNLIYSPVDRIGQWYTRVSVRALNRKKTFSCT